jgi:predicted PurR-regulated permease PerM
MNILIGLILFVTAVLAFVYLIRSKVMRAVGKLLHLGFIVLVLVVLSALFLPQAYRSLSEYTLQNTGTLETIRSIDGQVENLINVPQNFFDTIKDLLSGGSSEQSEETADEGILESRLYPALADALGFVYRIFALVLAIAGLIAVIYFSYSFENVSQIEKLEDRVRNLEKQLAGYSAASSSK